MTARSIRRAIERKARKQEQRLERNALDQQQQSVCPAVEKHIAAPDATSEARLAANRANAAFSTGPNTPEGKAKSSLNAVKTALTGRTVLLPSDDAILYMEHLQSFVDEFQPVGRREVELVQALADHSWRLMRIPALEMAIYASGHEQFAEHFADREPAIRNSLIQMHTFLHHEKQLRNLQIQEARLRRHRETDMTELRQLQQQRLAEPKQKSDAPAELDAAAPARSDTAENGFEFSMGDIDAQLDSVQEFLSTRRAALEQLQTASRPAIAA